jgi:predicted nucleotidyltransferase
LTYSFFAEMTTKTKDEATDLNVLFAGEPVVVAYLFGSRARGDAGPLSDVDVAVLLEGDFSPGDALALRLRLMEAIGRALGVERVDVVVLNGAPYLLQHRVIRDGRVFFCRDELTRVRYEFRVLRDYLDFRYFEDKYFCALEDRILREGLGARYRGHSETNR